MTAEERHAAQLLNGCTFLPGSWNKRFARSMAAYAEQEPERTLTPNQANNLWRLIVMHRRQLPSNLVAQARVMTGDFGPKAEPHRVRVSFGLERLYVWCEWCDNSHCIACLPVRSEASDLTMHEDWRGWSASLKAKDASTWLVFSDWCEENGFTALAAAIRKGRE